MMAKLKQLTQIIRQSYIVWAFLLLVVFDVGTRLSHAYWTLDRYNSPNRSWVWWTVNDFQKNKDQVDLVLMGSSLMMAVLHGGDATYLQLPQNVAFHHRSVLLERLLQEKSGTKVKTFAFALGGQMASDAYALCSTLFVESKKPKVIVYGIAPRDFMDNTLTSPASTETFRYMSRLGGLKDLGFQSRTTFWEQVEYILSCISALYDRRLDFVYLQNHYAKNILKHLFGFKDLDAVHTPFSIRKAALLSLPEDSGPNDLVIMPYKTEEGKYVDNLDEYRMRYRTFKPKIFAMQLSFLERMLKFCQERKILVCLVNMPLTQDNVQLMPPGFYENYKNRISSLAQKYSAGVIDLHDPALFKKEFFADSVHMNGAGGVKFFQVLAGKLNYGQRLVLGKTGGIQ